MTIKNKELQLAHDFVNGTDCNIFLTGKAGTGKTTFLHNLKKTTPKRMIVTAPTGVAAINAGGVTLHSFFQMPFGPFVPGQNDYERKNIHKFNKEKINIIKSLDLLVIDEISMVRADLLDGVDAVLRQYRRSNKPFGGVQLLMIGDLHQLSPVVNDTEWNILQDYYDSVYFFSSNSLKQTELISIELKHIYRQSDPKFINLLNQVRNNDLDQAAFEELNKRHQPQFSTEEHDNYITLCTHNSRAEAINQKRLAALPEKPHHFTAKIDGDFPAHSYPTAATLEMKKGAQVMFVRNDPSQDKLYYNGKIGQISQISAKSIRIKCPGDAKEITVEPTEWENIKYKVDQQSKEITENKIGTFSQYPLKMAWAITIHKSQGLTFEHAVIDAQAAFAHGQVYVALSRCKTLEGMILSTPISSGAIKTDAAVSTFTQDSDHNHPTKQQLAGATIAYQQKLVIECFDFEQLRSRLRWLSTQLYRNQQIIHLADNTIKEKEDKISIEIFKVSENFKQQLKQLFSDTEPESDPLVKERTSKASSYFKEKITTNAIAFIDNFSFETDNKEVRKNINKTVKQIQQEIAVKLAAVSSCQDGFSTSRYLRAISNAELDFKPPKNKTSSAAALYTEADIKHPELFQELRAWRSKKATELDVPHFHIMHQKVFIQIAIYLPDNILDLMKIQGFGPLTAEKYGNELVKIISKYRKKHNITIVAAPKTKEEDGNLAIKMLGKKNTKQISFGMFESGLSVEQIAQDRGLALTTIESHLVFFVEQGAIDISKFVPADKQEVIAQKLKEMPEATLTNLKEALQDKYSYSEINFTRAHENFRSTN